MEENKMEELEEQEEIETAEDVEETSEEEEQEQETPKEETPNNSNNQFKASTPFENTILAYLEDYASNDEAFKGAFNNPVKNIKDCCNYIINQVRKSGCNGFADEEIYKMARDYYVDEINKDDLKSIGGQVVVNHVVELTEEEKVKARVEALKKFEQEVLEEERKKREAEEKARAKEEEKARKKEEARIKKEQEKKAAEEQKKKEQENAPLGGLFDLF